MDSGVPKRFTFDLDSHRTMKSRVADPDPVFKIRSDPDPVFQNKVGSVPGFQNKGRIRIRFFKMKSDQDRVFKIRSDPDPGFKIRLDKITKIRFLCLHLVHSYGRFRKKGD